MLKKELEQKLEETFAELTNVKRRHADVLAKNRKLKEKPNGALAITNQKLRDEIDDFAAKNQQLKVDLIESRKKAADSLLVIDGLRQTRTANKDQATIYEQNRDSFIVLPWYKRMFFTRENLLFWFLHGEL